ncbi:33898_t:CDS:2, partial [Racocetra persica]
KEKSSLEAELKQIIEENAEKAKLRDDTVPITSREQKNIQSNSQHESVDIDPCTLTLSRISNSEASAKAHKSEQTPINQKVTRNQMVEQGLIQELTEFIIEESIEIKKSFYLNDKKTVTVQSLVHLYQKASLAEKNTIQAKQQEILCWYYYGKDFEKMTNPSRTYKENLSSDFSLSPKIELEVSENKVGAPPVSKSAVKETSPEIKTEQLKLGPGIFLETNFSAYKMVRRLRSGATRLSPKAISDIITAKGTANALLNLAKKYRALPMLRIMYHMHEFMKYGVKPLYNQFIVTIQSIHRL